MRLNTSSAVWRMGTTRSHLEETLMSQRLVLTSLGAFSLMLLAACGGNSHDHPTSTDSVSSSLPVTKAVTADPLPEATLEAINAEGIRGDVLVAALGRATTITGDDGQLLFSPARPWAGPPLPDGVRGTYPPHETLTIDQRLLPDDSTGLGQSIHDTRSFFAHNPTPGKYDGTVRIRFGLSPIAQSPEKDGTLMSVLTKATVETRFFDDDKKNILTHTDHMNAERPIPIRKDQLVRFDPRSTPGKDFLIQGWTRQGTSPIGQGTSQDLSLFVEPGERSDQFKLCLSVNNASVRRMTCSLWQVPAAWQWGKPLTYKGQDAWDYQEIPYEDCPPNASGRCTHEYYRLERFFRTVKDDAPHSQFGLPPVVNRHP